MSSRDPHDQGHGPPGGLYPGPLSQGISAPTPMPGAPCGARSPSCGWHGRAPRPGRSSGSWSSSRGRCSHTAGPRWAHPLWWHRAGMGLALAPPCSLLTPHHVRAPRTPSNTWGHGRAPVSPSPDPYNSQPPEPKPSAPTSPTHLPGHSPSAPAASQSPAPQAPTSPMVLQSFSKPPTLQPPTPQSSQPHITHRTPNYQLPPARPSPSFLKPHRAPLPTGCPVPEPPAPPSPRAGPSPPGSSRGSRREMGARHSAQR